MPIRTIAVHAPVFGRSAARPTKGRALVPRTRLNFLRLRTARINVRSEIVIK